MAKDAKDPGTGVTRELARYAANLRYEDIPAAVVSRTREVVLDCIGELLAGSTYPVGQAVARFARGAPAIWRAASAITGALSPRPAGRL